MYADLIGAIESVFSHSLSTVLLPPINLRGLIEKNMAFFRGTIYQREADLLYQFAYVYPVLPIEHQGVVCFTCTTNYDPRAVTLILLKKCWSS